MKKCTICNEVKSYESFSKMKSQKDGFNYWCKPCVKENRKDKDWHLNQYNERKRLWEYNKQHTDLEYKIFSRVRTRLSHYLKGRIKTTSYSKYLGCSIVEYKAFLENKFDNKMSWDNYGVYWEIDHIKPLSKGGSFHFTNTQPLSIPKNRKKGNKYAEKRI